MAVYFYAHKGRIKIGTSKRAEERRRDFERVLGEPMEVIAVIDGDFDREQAILAAHIAYQIEGEWFTDCPEMRASIANILAIEPLAKKKSAANPILTPAKPEAYGPPFPHAERHAIYQRALDRFFAPVDDPLMLLKRRTDSESLPSCLIDLIDDEIDVLSWHRTALVFKFHHDDRPPFESRDQLAERIRRADVLLSNIVVCNQEEMRRAELKA